MTVRMKDTEQWAHQLEQQLDVAKMRVVQCIRSRQHDDIFQDKRTLAAMEHAKYLEEELEQARADLGALEAARQLHGQDDIQSRKDLTIKQADEEIAKRSRPWHSKEGQSSKHSEEC